MNLKSIQEVLKEIVNLEEKIRNADPNVTYREGGKLVNHLDRLKDQLATAKRTLDNLQKLPKAVEAGEAITAARTGGVVTRVFTAIGRAIGLGSGTAATVAGIALTTVLLAGITYGAANYLGSRAGDAPVQPGPRFAQPASTAVQAPASTGAGPYFIYSINASGPNIYIGSQSDVQVPACNFTDGGLCHPGDPNVQVLATVGGPYDTYDQAVTAYCGIVTNIRSEYGGSKGDINGTSYWLDNAPGC